MIIRLIASVILLLLTACEEVKVVNGEIPDKYLGEAKKYEGRYRGRFEGYSGEFIVSFEGNKPRFNYKNRHNDILNAPCSSVTGDLLKFTPEQNPNTKEVFLKNATFAFSANKCKNQVIGEDIKLNFKQTHSGLEVLATILQAKEEREECYENHFGLNDCRKIIVNKYLSGTFYR